MRGKVYVGISGWNYPRWRGVFYPKGLPQAQELAFASRAFDSIEINGSFYSLVRPERVARWHDEAPAHFVFSLKGSRYITHIKRLAGVETALANFFASGVLALEEKLGPILWQLPPTMAFDAGRLDAFFALLPRTTRGAAALARKHDDRLNERAHTRTAADRPIRHVLEPRHPSFHDPAFAALARKWHIATCISDTAGRHPMFEELTANFVYVRLHGDTELYRSKYGEAALKRWAARVRAWRARYDVFVYFDNDAEVHAPFDARALRELVHRGEEEVGSKCAWE